MPLFEVETDSHIIITWAEDDQAAQEVVYDNYPTEKPVRVTPTSSRYLGDFQSSTRDLGPDRSLFHRPRLLGQSRRRQSPCDPPLHAANR